MTELPPKRRKQSEATKEELLLLDKEELVEKLLQFQKHNIQLRNIISKNCSDSNSDIKSRKKQFDFSKCHYRRILLRIMYFGWDYQGFVVQEDSPNTIEHCLFQALTKTCLVESREKAQYHRCGRTDKGVSAFGQVISLSIRSKHPPEDQYKPEAISSEIPYCSMLNRLLPADIKAVAWMPIPADKPDYSSRFDCKRRQYKYYFPRSSLDIAAMRDACARLVGSHDFRHLCKMDVGNGVVQFTREIFTANILPVDGKESDECTAMYYLLIEGNAFLWHQIRCIMGVLLLIGEGKEKPDVVSELLDIVKNTRKPQYNMAIDVPLNLFQCSYDLEESNNWVYTKEELRQTITDLQKNWAMYNIKCTMLKDSLKQLQRVYSTMTATDDKTNESEGDSVVEYASGLRQGINPRIYKPLFERETCYMRDSLPPSHQTLRLTIVESTYPDDAPFRGETRVGAGSLEERIDYYKRKRSVKEPKDSTNGQKDHTQSMDET